METSEGALERDRGAGAVLAASKVGVGGGGIDRALERLEDVVDTESVRFIDEDDDDRSKLDDEVELGDVSVEAMIEAAL